MQAVPGAEAGIADITIVRSSLLANVDDVIHGFSTRTGGVSRVYRREPIPTLGDLNLGFTASDDAESVRENRRRFRNALGAPAIKHFVLLRQEHTAIVQVIGDSAALATDFSAPGTLRGDGLMTNVPGVLLAIGTADCLPVLVLDPVQRAVAAFHAGWRGTLARIVELGVGAMCRQYGSRPDDLLAVIGPGIGPASYAVSPQLREQFESEFRYAAQLFREVQMPEAASEVTSLPSAASLALPLSPMPQISLDLWQANRQQLLDAGVPAGHIELLGLDTATDTTRFFSHRAEHGHTGRMLSVIGLTA